MPIGIVVVQSIVDFLLEDQIEYFLDSVGDAWNDFWSFS